MSENNAFVYVVCGEAKHIHTLHYSISCLKKFTKKNILVITDSERNEIPIIHEHITNVKTPEKLTYHQASIYLKTSIFKYLPSGNKYCYLDSDVIALSPEIDSIFSFETDPIMFVSDHCSVPYFSPSALNCGCTEIQQKKIQELESLIKKYNPYFDSEKLLKNAEFREFHRMAISVRRKPYQIIPSALKFLWFLYVARKPFFRLNKNILYDRKNKTWIDNKGNIILYHVLNYYKNIETESNFRFKFLKMAWVDQHGKNIYNCSCDHLICAINKKFKIQVTNRNWNHWNGGVFLFSDNSHVFLETWHQFTLEIFEDTEWKTRDQGTLIATVWKYNLQNKKRLPKEYNFIADFYNPENTYNEEKGFTYNNFRSSFKPNFIHVYHQFGNRDWEIWKAIEKITFSEYNEGS